MSGVNAARGSSFNDTLLGSNRNENFLGGRGDDLIDGRNGFDRAVYNTSSDDAVTSGITVNLAAGTVQGDASVGNDTLRSIEAVQGTDFADSYNATGFGVTGNNLGNNGTFNEFEGGGGNDIITGNSNTRIAFYNAAAASRSIWPPILRRGRPAATLPLLAQIPSPVLARLRGQHLLTR